MAFHHRKLLLAQQQQDHPTTVQTCLNFCSLPSNETSSSAGLFCPQPCLAICPSTCKFSMETLISPLISPTQPNNSPNMHHNLSPLLISMLIILASAFLMITLYTIYTKLYLSSSQTRPNNNNDNDNHVHGESTSVVFHPVWYIPTVGLDPGVITCIKVCKYGDENNHVDVSDCAVCLAEFELGDELRVLPKCDHAFHLPCIDTWLKSHTNCPLCRAPISKVPADDDDGVTAEVGDEGEVRERSRKGEFGFGSFSQRWGDLERGAAVVNLVSRSLSCGAKIFSSRYCSNSSDHDDHDNDRTSPNS